MDNNEESTQRGLESTEVNQLDRPLNPLIGPKLQTGISKTRTKRIILTICLILAASILTVAGLLLYRALNSPPNNWKKISDQTSGVSFYFPPCTRTGNGSSNLKNMHTGTYDCGLSNPTRALSVIVSQVNNPTSSDTSKSNSDIYTYLSNYLTNNNKAHIKVNSKVQTTLSGYPAIKVDETVTASRGHDNKNLSMRMLAVYDEKTALTIAIHYSSFTDSALDDFNTITRFLTIQS